MILSEENLRSMVYGGAVLGAGGGGSLAAGLAAIGQALERGLPELIDIRRLPPQATLVTLSTVGPVFHSKAVAPEALQGRALELLQRLWPGTVQGIISSEVGPLAVTYGARESANSGIPLVDAPANGRAHPLGLMGSLGLHRFPRRRTIAAAVGGQRDTEHYVELTVTASAAHAATIVRRISAAHGVPLAVARHPLPAAYVARHAAVGGLTNAIRVGRVLLTHRNQGLPAVLPALSQVMGGAVIAEGTVAAVRIGNIGGFTVGTVELRTSHGQSVEVSICNEYLLITREGDPLAVFPDLIVLFNQKTSLPLGTGEVSAGMRVAVLGVPQQRLELGSPMADRRLLRHLERLLGRRLPARGMAAAQCAT